MKSSQLGTKSKSWNPSKTMFSINMQHLKTAIITTLLLLGACIVYVFCYFDDSYQVRASLDHYLKGNFEEANSILTKIHPNGTNPEYFLYQAYISREWKGLETSNAFLNKAAALAKHGKENNPKLEIVLNQALNAYLAEDSKGLEEALQRGQHSTSSDNEWIALFQDLAAQKEATSKLWEKILDIPTLSPWMERAFHTVFTLFRIKIHRAQNMIEKGNWLQARQLLDQALETCNETEKDEINFYIGLSYSREAQSKPPSAAGPYYKLAFGHFDRIPFHYEKYRQQKDRLIGQIENQIQVLLKEKNLHDLPVYFAALERLDSPESTEKFSNALLKTLKESLDGKNTSGIVTLISLLHQSPPQTSTLAAFQTYLEEKVRETLNDNDISKAMAYWNALTFLTDGNEELYKKYWGLINEKIKTLFDGD